MFGIEYPIVQAGMVWTSGQKLAVACAEAGAPVICHILTGHSYVKHGHKPGAAGIKDSVNTKTFDSSNTLFDRCGQEGAQLLQWHPGFCFAAGRTTSFVVGF